MYETEIKNMDLGQCQLASRPVLCGLLRKRSMANLVRGRRGRYVEVMQNGSHFLFSCEED